MTTIGELLASLGPGRQSEIVDNRRPPQALIAVGAGFYLYFLSIRRRELLELLELRRRQVLP